MRAVPPSPSSPLPISIMYPSSSSCTRSSPGAWLSLPLLPLLPMHAALLPLLPLTPLLGVSEGAPVVSSSSQFPPTSMPLAPVSACAAAMVALAAVPCASAPCELMWVVAVPEVTSPTLLLQPPPLLPLLSVTVTALPGKVPLLQPVAESGVAVAGLGPAAVTAPELSNLLPDVTAVAAGVAGGSCDAGWPVTGSRRGGTKKGSRHADRYAQCGSCGGGDRDRITEIKVNWVVAINWESAATTSRLTGHTQQD